MILKTPKIPIEKGKTPVIFLINWLVGQTKTVALLPAGGTTRRTL
jgi:hypothetical protein